MASDPEFIGLLHLARELRLESTSAEWLLWELLRGRRFLGLKFRRQHPIGNFIVDFFCREQRLVIEVDGGVHDEEEQAAKDVNRDAYLRQLSYEVVRLSNQQVLENPQQALAEIARHCKGVLRPRDHDDQPHEP